MRHDSAAFPVRADRSLWRQFLSVPTMILLLGCAALAIPTMIGVAQVSWSTEQGGHGPLVMATGAWLLWRELKVSRAAASPGKLWIGLLGLATCLIVFLLSRITGTLEVEAFAMYGSLISAAYLLFGGAVLRSIWFPLIYLAFALPPPETVVAAVTQPIKIAISEGAVWLLHAVGYPVASSGVTIQIAQYELLVAAACAGLELDRHPERLVLALCVSSPPVGPDPVCCHLHGCDTRCNVREFHPRPRADSADLPFW